MFLSFFLLLPVTHWMLLNYFLIIAVGIKIYSILIEYYVIAILYYIVDNIIFKIGIKKKVSFKLTFF